MLLNVFALMECMNWELNVKNVKYNVRPVLQLMPVSNVPETVSIHQSVTVQNTPSIPEPKPVQTVVTNVNTVLNRKITVISVPESESVSHGVHVHKVISKILSSLMIARLAAIDAKAANLRLKTVSNVSKTESIHQSVPVLLDLMMMDKMLNVSHVVTTVLAATGKVVSHVLETVSKLLIVIVHSSQDTMIMGQLNVQLVIINAKPVHRLKNVKYVLLIEDRNLPVNVQKDGSKMKKKNKLNVQNVTKNVTFVSTIHRFYRRLYHHFY
jgi:hypothetical protein